MKPNLFEEPRISFTAAAKRCGVGRATVYRWVRLGVRGVHLEAANVGGQMFTTIPALDRFSKSCADRFRLS